MAAIVEKSRLTSKEKTQLRMAKLIKSILESKDGAVSDLRTMANYAIGVADVLEQQNDGANKRFSGAASHELADNAAAFVNTVTRGNLPTAS